MAQKIERVIGLMLMSGLMTAWATNLDANGTRVLSKLPPPGVHPRVLFTVEDLPDIAARLADDGPYGKTIVARLRREVQSVKSQSRELAELGDASVTLELLKKHFKSNEGRNIAWGVTSIFAVMDDDPELKNFMIRVITGYARVMLTSRAMMLGDVEGRTGYELNQNFNVWERNSFDLGVCWIMGGAGMAVSYDVLYNDMTDDQRAVVRSAIAAGIKDRVSYGMDMPKGRAISNHYGYHGDLALSCAAIEGEDGYDEATYRRIEQVLTDYFTVGFTPDGACHEDTYGPNLGMREGSRGLMVLARRGKNLFKTQQYRNFFNYMVQSIEPFDEGGMVGGASGATGGLYPTSIIMAHYLRPNDPAARHLYRWLVGPDYKRSMRWQGFLDYCLFGMPMADDGWRPESAGEVLPLSEFYDRRGKLITRSDWSADALYFHFDARPDAFTIGHDTVDRGTFMLSAQGRTWVPHNNWSLFRTSDCYSLVHIDGKAQGRKAPSVNFQKWNDDGDVVTAVADLKYAYDWQWSPPWPTEDKKFQPPWEPETTDPRDLGWPDDPDWLPHTLYGTPDIGYVGSYMWRKPFNPVMSARRGVLLKRGVQPYVVIADDIQKDDKVRRYDWMMQLADDVLLEKQTGRQIVLKERSGDRRLLVYVLRADGADGKRANVSATCETYKAGVNNRTKEDVNGRRLVLSVDSVSPHFRILVMPLSGDAVALDSAEASLGVLEQALKKVEE